MPQQNRTLDSKNIRSTLQTNYSEHLEFLCSRPTLRVPVSDMQKTMLWQEYQMMEECEIEIALEELDIECIDIDLEELQ